MKTITILIEICKLLTIKQRFTGLAVALLQTVAAFSEGILSIFLFFALSSLDQNSVDSSGSFSMFLPNSYMVEYRLGFIEYISIAVVLQIVKSILLYFSKMQLLKLLTETQEVLIHRYEDKILAMPFDEIINKKHGELLAPTKVPFAELEGVFVTSIGLLNSTIYLLTLGGILLLLSPLFSLFVLFAYCIFTFVQRSLVRMVTANSQVFSDRYESHVSSFSQICTNLKLIISLNRQSMFKRKMRESTTSAIKSFADLKVTVPKSSLINEVGIFSLFLFTTWIGYYILIVRSHQSLSVLITYLMTLHRLGARVSSFMFDLFQVSAISCEVEKILPKKDKVQTKQSTTTPKRVHSFESIQFLRTDLSVGGDKLLITNASFCVKKGEKIAFVGPTGAGKTSLINAILGFLLPSSGDIEINGESVRGIDLGLWREQFGIVSQDTSLLNATIRENVTFGIEDSVSDKEVYNALKTAGLDKLVSELPDGVGSIIGEKGLRLSGGEAQRLSLARAIFSKPQILILDEATSALDSLTEKRVMDDVNKIGKEITIIAVAHRLSTIQAYDNIYVVQDGEILQSGTHEQLLVSNGLYSNMWYQQQNEEERVREKAFV